MAAGTLFTLFVIPSIYMLVARDHSLDREKDEIGRDLEGEDSLVG